LHVRATFSNECLTKRVNCGVYRINLKRAYPFVNSRSIVHAGTREGGARPRAPLDRQQSCRVARRAYKEPQKFSGRTQSQSIQQLFQTGAGRFINPFSLPASPTGHVSRAHRHRGWAHLRLVVSAMAAEFAIRCAAHDLPTFASVAGLFVLVSLAAVLVPARRATKIDSTTALRAD
jgi:hypothetical protein